MAQDVCVVLYISAFALPPRTTRQPSSPNLPMERWPIFSAGQENAAWLQLLYALGFGRKLNYDKYDFFFVQHQYVPDSAPLFVLYGAKRGSKGTSVVKDADYFLTCEAKRVAAVNVTSNSLQALQRSEYFRRNLDKWAQISMNVILSLYNLRPNEMDKDSNKMILENGDDEIAKALVQRLAHKFWDDMEGKYDYEAEFTNRTDYKNAYEDILSASNLSHGLKQRLSDMMEVKNAADEAKILELEEAGKKKDAKIKAFEEASSMGDSTAALGAANIQITDLKAELVQKGNEMADKEKSIADLKTKVTEKEDEITKKSGELADKEKSIADLKTKVSEKEDEITKKSRELGDKEKSIVDLKAKVAEKETEIASLDSKVTAQKGEIASLNSKVVLKEGKILELKTNVDDAEKKQQDSMKEIQRLTSEIQKQFTQIASMASTATPDADAATKLLAEELAKQTQSITSLTTENNSLKTNLEQSKQSSLKLQEENNTHKIDIQTLKHQLSVFRGQMGSGFELPPTVETIFQDTTTKYNEASNVEVIKQTNIDIVQKLANLISNELPNDTFKSVNNKFSTLKSSENNPARQEADQALGANKDELQAMTYSQLAATLYYQLLRLQNNDIITNDKLQELTVSATPPDDGLMSYIVMEDSETQPEEYNRRKNNMVLLCRFLNIYGFKSHGVEDEASELSSLLSDMKAWLQDFSQPTDIIQDKVAEILEYLFDLQTTPLQNFIRVSQDITDNDLYNCAVGLISQTFSEETDSDEEHVSSAARTFLINSRSNFTPPTAYDTACTETLACAGPPASVPPVKYVPIGFINAHFATGNMY